MEANSDQCIYEYFSDNTLIIYDVKAGATSVDKIHYKLSDPNEQDLFAEVHNIINI